MGDGACTAASSLTVRVTIGALPRFIGLLSGGSYAERADGRWSVYCSILPDGSGYHWCVAEVYRIIEGWVLRGACVWAMERVLQHPP